MLRIILVLLVGGPRLGGLHLQKRRFVDGHSRGAHSPPLAFRNKHHPSLSIIGPVMQLFQAYLGAPTTGRIGAQHARDWR